MKDEGLLLGENKILKAKSKDLNRKYPNLFTEDIRRKTKVYSEDVEVCKAQLAHCKPLIYQQGFDEGIRKATDACNSTFDAQLKHKVEEAKKAERERIINKIRTYTGSYIDKRFWLCKFWQALKDS